MTIVLINPANWHEEVVPRDGTPAVQQAERLAAELDGLTVEVRDDFGEVVRRFGTAPAKGAGEEQERWGASVRALEDAIRVYLDAHPGHELHLTIGDGRFGVAPLYEAGFAYDADGEEAWIAAGRPEPGFG